MSASIFCAVTSRAAESGKLKVGDKAPSLVGMKTDGSPLASDAYKSAKVIVIAFTGNECPVAGAYEARFVEFAKKYKKRGVTFVAVNANGEPLEDVARRAKTKKLPYDYLTDLKQQAGRRFGALATPHLFVLDQKRVLRYVGAFDDSFRGGDSVKKHYVVDAVEALLAGKPVKDATTRPVGCRISYPQQ